MDKIKESVFYVLSECNKIDNQVYKYKNYNYLESFEKFFDSLLRNKKIKYHKKKFLNYKYNNKGLFLANKTIFSTDVEFIEYENNLLLTKCTRYEYYYNNYNFIKNKKDLEVENVTFYKFDNFNVVFKKISDIKFNYNVTFHNNNKSTKNHIKNIVKLINSY